MTTRDNKGNIVGEIKTSIASDGRIITTNTMYDNGQAVAQHIASVDNQGRTSSLDIFGKILP